MLWFMLLACKKDADKIDETVALVLNNVHSHLFSQ